MKCSFCGEKIKDEAIKCRFCGEFLNQKKEKRSSKKTEEVTIISKAKKIWLIVGIISFIAAFSVNISQGFFEGMLNGIMSGLITGYLSFLLAKVIIRNELDFVWWQWIIYTFGWLFGLLNIGFWVVMSIFYFTKDKGLPYFNKSFHKRVYYWGLTILILLIIGIIYNILQYVVLN